MRGTLKTPVRFQKNPVRKSIPTSRNQEESEHSSDEDYRYLDDVLNPYASQTDGYDSEYESTVDSVLNQNISECDFSKISCVETESDLEKPANAELAKIIKKNCVFVPPKVNLELWKLLSGWQLKSDIKFMSIQKSLVRTMNASLSII